MIRNKYYVETIAFLSYVLFAMAWVGGTANMSEIMEAMNVQSMASASLLSGAVTLAKIVGTFTAALLALRVGVKWAFLVSALMVGFGFLTPFSPNYELLLLSRFAMGLGGALMIVYFNPIVMQWFSPRERPTINGINAVAFNVGTGIVLWLIQDINALTGGWQNTLATFSVVSLVLAGLWTLVDFKDRSPQQKTTQNQEPHYGYWEGLKDPFVWIYALTFSGLLAFYICVFTFYPQAGIAQSTSVIGFGILGTLAGIIYNQCFPKRLPLIRWSGVALTLAILGLSFSADSMVQNVSAMVLGFCIFMPYAALITLPQELPGMNGTRVTVIFSIFYAVSYLVATLVLWVFGWLVDVNNGSYEMAFALIAVISTTLFVGSFYLPETGVSPEETQEGEALASN
ncbi:MFS transporter [Pseudomaricurvus alkylphenolicus]|uniref:MFS transporter n=1 Tax=Pseudomaricurvus alkylphenolicus TaxID=1306991 RepID=UPI00197E714E